MLPLSGTDPDDAGLSGSEYMIGMVAKGSRAMYSVKRRLHIFVSSEAMTAGSGSSPAAGILV